jgi:hypothetical protein
MVFLGERLLADPRDTREDARRRLPITSIADGTVSFTTCVGTTSSQPLCATPTDQSQTPSQIHDQGGRKAVRGTFPNNGAGEEPGRLTARTQPLALTIDAVEHAGVEAFAVDDEKSDMVTLERLAPFEPHDEKASSRFEAEARKAAFEGTPV